MQLHNIAASASGCKANMRVCQLFCRRCAGPAGTSRFLPNLALHTILLTCTCEGRATTRQQVQTGLPSCGKTNGYLCLVRDHYSVAKLLSVLDIVYTVTLFSILLGFVEWADFCLPFSLICFSRSLFSRIPFLRSQTIPLICSNIFVLSLRLPLVTVAKSKKGRHGAIR